MFLQGVRIPEVSKYKKSEGFSRFPEPWGFKIQENRRFFKVSGALRFLNRRKPLFFQGLGSLEVSNYKKPAGFSRFPEPWGFKIQEVHRFYKVSGALRSQNIGKPSVFRGFRSPEVSKYRKTAGFSRFSEPWGLKIQENLSRAQIIVRFAAICRQTLPPWRQKTRKPKALQDFRSPEVSK